MFGCGRRSSPARSRFVLATLGFVDPHADEQAVIPWLFAILVVAETIRAISYTAFIAWVSTLFGRRNVGRLFGYREFGVVGVTMALPPLVALLRDDLSKASEVSDASSYAIVFLLADALVFLGIAVMALLPDVEKSQADESDSSTESVWKTTSRLFRDRSFRRISLTSFHLAAAQGLTQSVFFKYQVDVLDVSLTNATLLATLMYAVQLPLSIATGHWLDRTDNKQIYMLGITIVAGAIPFWFFAERDPRYLAGAFVFYGAFAIVNVAGRSTVLRLVNQVDVPTAIGVFRFGAGVLAAITGLLGGIWLDKALTGSGYLTDLGPYLTIIFVSGLGRVTAPLWLMGWEDDRVRPQGRRF